MVVAWCQVMLADLVAGAGEVAVAAVMVFVVVVVALAVVAAVVAVAVVMALVATDDVSASLVALSGFPYIVRLLRLRLSMA